MLSFLLNFLAFSTLKEVQSSSGTAVMPWFFHHLQPFFVHVDSSWYWKIWVLVLLEVNVYAVL